MARGRRNRPAREPAGAPGRGQRNKQPPRDVSTRVAILAILLLLTVYAGFAINRLQRESKSLDPGVTEVELAAVKVDASLALLRAALSSAVDGVDRAPGAWMDAVEGLRRHAGGAASAAAFLRNGQIQAVSGKALPEEWSKALDAANQADNAFWLGQVGADIYAVERRLTDDGRLAAIARVDLTPALKGHDLTVVSTPRGLIVASLDPDWLHESVQAVMGVKPGRSAAGAEHPAAGGALLVISARGDPTAALRQQADRANLLALLAPLAIGRALTLLLVIQSRRTAMAQTAQAEIEQRFRLAVEAARCGIWEWDLDHDRVFMSEVTGVIFGWGGAGVVSGGEVLARISAEHRDRVHQALMAAPNHGAFDVSFKVPTVGGGDAWIDARGQAIVRTTSDKGRLGRIVGVAIDVTDERLAQSRAQAAEQRLRDAIESVSQAFVLWDRTGRLLMCNQTYRAFFNLEPKLLKPGAEYKSVNRYVRMAIRRETPSPDGKTGAREAELVDGRWVSISERRTADGGLVMTAADITAMKTQDEARKQNEAALEKAVENLERSQAQLADIVQKYEGEKIRAEAANKAKSEFLANMSHELRTPLNAINGFSEIMVAEMFGAMGDARYKEYAQDILSSGQHLLALINDILDMAKIEAGKMSLKFEPMQFEDVAEDAVRLMRNRAESAGLRMAVDMGELPDIDGDYRAIKQILLNLLSNAIKFTPRGGGVTLRAESIATPVGQRLRVSVQDTGIGIAKEDLARLAKPFEQIESQHSKTQQGTGLGLALTKSLVEMHGGALHLDSEPGAGTTVSFIIPVRRDEANNSYAA